MESNEATDGVVGKLDERVGRALGHFSQSTSRRGILARLSKLVLAVTGATLVLEVLPVDRTVAEAANCGDWRLCGIYGRTCDCCNGGNPLNYCPACSTWNNYWSSCCCQSWWNCSTIYYWDCLNCCANCSGCTWCSNNSPQPLWGNGSYCCTAVVVGSGC